MAYMVVISSPNICNILTSFQDSKVFHDSLVKSPNNIQFPLPSVNFKAFKLFVKNP